MPAQTSLQYDLHANYAQKLQEYSDNAAAIMQSLANHVASVQWTGTAAIAMHNAHEQLNAAVAKHTTAFADGAQSGHNTVQLGQNQEDESSSHIHAAVNMLS